MHRQHSRFLEASQLRLGAVLLVAASIGCKEGSAGTADGGSTTSAGPGAGAIARPIVHGFTDTPETLIPYRRGNEASRHLQELIFDGLVNRKSVSPDGRQEFKWALATQYSEKSDAERKVFTVDLRKSVHWHDGRDFTADDVVYSWNALGDSKAPMAGWLQAFIAEVTAVDKQTIQMKLRCERSEEVVKELLSSFKILPAKAKIGPATQTLPTDLSSGAAADDFGFHPVGTGPFKLDQDFTPNGTHFAAYLDYMLGPPITRSLVAQRIEDYSLLITRLSKGDVNLVTDVRPESFRALESAPLRNSKYYPYQFEGIFYNIERLPFQNLPFRRGVTAGTDRAELAARANGEKGTDVAEFLNKSLFPHNYEQVMAAPESYSSTLYFDRVQASDLLKSSRQPPSFALLISSQKDGENAKRIAEAYQQQMHDIGVDVRILDESESRYLTMLRPREGADATPEYQAALVSVAGLDHFYDIRSLFFAEGKRRGGLPALLEPVIRTNRDLAGLLQAFGQTISFDKLSDITRKIHKAVDAATPMCPLFTLPRHAYFPKSATGVTVHPEVGYGDVRGWSFGG